MGRLNSHKCLTLITATEWPYFVNNNVFTVLYTHITVQYLELPYFSQPRDIGPLLKQNIIAREFARSRHQTELKEGGREVERSDSMIVRWLRTSNKTSGSSIGTTYVYMYTLPSAKNPQERSVRSMLGPVSCTGKSLTVCGQLQSVEINRFALFLIYLILKPVLFWLY